MDEPALLWQVRIIHAGHLQDLLRPSIVCLRPCETLDAVCRRLIDAAGLEGRVLEEVQVRLPLLAGAAAPAAACPTVPLGTAAAAAGAAAGAAAEPPEKNAAPLAPHCAVCCSIPHVCVGTKLGYQLRWYETSPSPHFCFL